MQPYIHHHNSDEIDYIQIKKALSESHGKKTKGTKELNKTLCVNNKLSLTKLIRGGGFVKPN